MRVGLFKNVRGGISRFAPYAAQYGNALELVQLPCDPLPYCLDAIGKARCEALIYSNDHKETPEFFAQLAAQGIRYLVTCSSGYDQFDLHAMKTYGIHGANVPQYSPNAISEYTVMIALALLRKLRRQMLRIDAQRFGIDGLRGRELRNMAVGIIGAGHIGRTTIQCLSGFCPREILVYTLHPRWDQPVQYVSLDEIYQRADILIFHCAATSRNYHMVDAKAIQKMKDGIILINSARGTLFDTQAVLDGIESGKIGALGLDVIEGEGALRKAGCETSETARILQQLLRHDNVIYTTHTAFYTDQADHTMTQTAMHNLYEYATAGQCRNELVQ